MPWGLGFDLSLLFEPTNRLRLGLTTTDWNDSWFFALSATWRPAPVWTLRAGVAFDQSPVPDRTRDPRIPDADHQWLSLGVGYEPAPGSRSKPPICIFSWTRRGSISIRLCRAMRCGAT
ncbi:OmpP1/FadL family transporter [Virgifigura deserti]|uniref:OmpP1/FadL family transporter n=1 Tax=Virgifigura deserti TaxID=2268457 RepID=UPI003CCBAA23